MLPPHGYTLTKPLRSNPQSDVYAAVREIDGYEVILKAYPNDATASGRARARGEFEALRAAAGSGVPKAIELVPTSGAPILVLERVPGVSLATWVDSHLPAPEEWLKVAVQLAEVLARVHAARLIHRDISPNNVVVDPATLETHVIDFGLTLRLGAISGSLGAGAEPDELAGTLPYIAPEQTGRMNRGIDARSDLYSLGATLYFTLTGCPPFAGDDALALIHAHMAILPRPPEELRPELPEILSRLVLKLLQKEPENRYPSARTLLADLQRCRDLQAQEVPVPGSFPLGAGEATDRPRFHRKLYGRDVEIARLCEAYAHAAAGSIQALMLAGEPGTGKSALVDELRRVLAETGGISSSASSTCPMTDPTQPGRPR